MQHFDIASTTQRGAIPRFIRRIADADGVVLELLRCDTRRQGLDQLEHWPPPSRLTEFAFLAVYALAEVDEEVFFVGYNPWLLLTDDGKARLPTSDESWEMRRRPPRLAPPDERFAMSVSDPVPLHDLEHEIDRTVRWLERCGIREEKIALLFDSRSTPLPPKHAPAPAREAA